VVQSVIDAMGGIYPELVQRAKHILETTTAEEERFLTTIDAGMARFDELAPPATTQGSTAVRGTISGEDAFILYDRYGFPIDLTELMARERGYTVDIAGFEAALAGQRQQSQADRKAKKIGVAANELTEGAWQAPSAPTESVTPREITDTAFVGYETIEIETQVTAMRRLDDDRVAVMLRETPFYAESGGQISDVGEIIGEGWRVDVDDVRRVDGRIAALGRLTGPFTFGRVIARVPSDRRRDTERNHTATHLLHAALRQVLGDHVHQAGSLVAPDRLRFDFTHHGPVKPEALTDIEERVNRAIWADVDVVFQEKSYREAVEAGAMALFGEKYGDVVRVVSIPGYSMELCGGTHARTTGQIALFKIVAETGVAAGVRRIEAVTGPRAYELIREEERRLQRIVEVVKGTPDSVVKRVEGLVEERRQLQRRLDESMRGGGDQVATLITGARAVNGARVVAAEVRVSDAKELQALADALREKLGSGVGVLGASFGEKTTMLVVVTDDLRDKGVRADALVRDIAAVAGGRGGGKPHLAQAGLPDASRLAAAIEQAPQIVERALASA
jgi:alanyl-tRNA synthetase